MVPLGFEPGRHMVLFYSNTEETELTVKEKEGSVGRKKTFQMFLHLCMGPFIVFV